MQRDPAMITLLALSPSTLQAVGDYLSKIAQSCLAEAAKIDNRKKMQADIEAAIAARPRPDTPYWRRIARKEARAARDTEIMRLAGRGWCNGAIAAKMGLSTGRISQIVQRQLRKQAQCAQITAPAP